MSVLSRLGSVAALGVLLGSVPGLAQEAEDLRLAEAVDEPDDVVVLAPSSMVADAESPVVRRERVVVDPYAAQGVGQGPIRLFPSLEIGTLFTSNAGAATSNAEADVALRIKPGLRLESNWPRHQLTASATVEMQRYLDHQELSSTTADIEAALRLDIRRATKAELDWHYGLSSQSATDGEVPDSASGNRLTHSITANAALIHEAGAFDLKLGAGFDREIFSDVDLSGGGSEDNSDRNYTEVNVKLRGVFNPGAKLQPFVEVAYAPRFHDETSDRNGVKRNSKGYAITAGLRIDDDPVWSGEIAASYLLRDYDEANLATEKAPGLLANLLWRPTEITSVNFNASVALNETSTVGEGARTNWNFGATLARELRENIILSAGANFDLTEATGGHDLTTSVVSALEWQANPFFAWRVGYQGTWFNGATSDDYAEHQVLGSIILRR